MLSAGELIWASCRPLLRLMFCAAGGFILTKTDNFPPVAARGAGQVALNILLPCLMFSKIVPAFTTDNISALGPLVLVAILYEAIGLAMAWMIKQFFWVPHRFRYGLLVAGGWGNYGDIPTSVIVSVAGAAPFNGTADQNLAVAYISVFILVFMLTLFPGGGSRLVAMDFEGPDVEPEEVQEAVRRRRRAFIYAIPNALASFVGKRRPISTISMDESADRTLRLGDEEKPTPAQDSIQNLPTNEHTHDSVGSSSAMETSAGRHVSFHTSNTHHTDDIRSGDIYSPTPTEVGFYTSAIHSPEPTVLGGDVPESSHGAKDKEALPTSSYSPPVSSSPPKSPILLFLRSLFSLLLAPASLSILISLPISLIPPLKGLFVALPASNSTSPFENPHIHPAPDGLPPLNIILDTATFIGAASVPVGLVCLGAALARMDIPRNQWRTLPTGAIASLAIAKMIIAPVIGVGIVQGLVKGGIIDQDNKLLQFVCIFFSCLPTATTQVYLTQVFSGTGSADNLPAFLIPQYIIMFISMTALTAYSLNYLF